MNLYIVMVALVCASVSGGRRRNLKKTHTKWLVRGTYYRGMYAVCLALCVICQSVLCVVCVTCHCLFHHHASTYIHIGGGPWDPPGVIEWALGGGIRWYFFLNEDMKWITAPPWRGYCGYLRFNGSPPWFSSFKLLPHEPGSEKVTHFPNRRILLCHNVL